MAIHQVTYAYVVQQLFPGWNFELCFSSEGKWQSFLKKSRCGVYLIKQLEIDPSEDFVKSILPKSLKYRYPLKVKANPNSLSNENVIIPLP